MNKLGTSILIASSVLVFGCMPESAAPASTGSTTTGGTTTGGTTTGGTATGGGSTTVTTPVRGQTALIDDKDLGDTGELRYELDTTIAAGKVSIDVYYASDETETAYVGIYGTKADSHFVLAEVMMDVDNSPVDGEVGIKLRVNGVGNTTTTDTIATFTVDTWTTIEIEWDVSSVTYNVSIDGAAQSGFTMNPVDNNDDDVYDNGVENVKYIDVKISSKSKVAISATPLYVDNLEVFSDAVGDTAVYEDNFEGYAVDYDLATGAGTVYNDNGYGATVSDDFVE